MTLPPDKIELAQQIADALEEGIKAGPHVFFHTTHPQSAYGENLIKPLLGKYQIDTLLESMPSHSAKSLRAKHSRLIYLFDSSGKLLNQNLSLTTIDRYATDLINELRNVGQGGKRKHKLRSKKKNTISSIKDSMVPPEIPTRRVSLAQAAKWFECDSRTLKKDIDSSKIRARQISNRRWEFDLDQVTEFNSSLQRDADPMERSKTQ